MEDNEAVDNNSNKNWKSVDEYLQAQRDIYEEILLEKHDDLEKKIKFHLYFIDNPYTLGLYISLKNENWNILNDTLYQSSRQKLLDITEDGYDHSGEFWEVMDAMACNDIEALEACFPKNIGLCNNGYPAFVIASNMLIKLWYNTFEKDDKVLEKARKMLTQKKSLWEKAIVGFLLAIYDKDMEYASRQLDEVCKSSRRIDKPSLHKYFCPEAHGLYNIARMILEKDIFEKLKFPEDEGFIDEFAIWQKDNNYPKGELFVVYPKELDFMNKLLKCDIPKCRLHNPYKNKKVMYRDCEIMRECIVNDLAL